MGSIDLVVFKVILGHPVHLHGIKEICISRNIFIVVCTKRTLNPNNEIYISKKRGTFVNLHVLMLASSRASKESGSIKTKPGCSWLLVICHLRWVSKVTWPSFISALVAWYTYQVTCTRPLLTGATLGNRSPNAIWSPI